MLAASACWHELPKGSRAVRTACFWYVPCQAANLREAIKEGAEELLSEKRVVSGAVNIRSNREKMKVRTPAASKLCCTVIRLLVWWLVRFCTLLQSWNDFAHRKVLRRRTAWLVAWSSWKMRASCDAAAGELQGVNAFWVTSLAPESKLILDKPDMNTYCPATGKKLRLKDLIPVKLTKVLFLLRVALNLDIQQLICDLAPLSRQQPCRVSCRCTSNFCKSMQ